MRLLRRAYALGAVAWLAALPFGVYLATREHASTLVHAAAFTIYSVGSLLCHQRPERSFHLLGTQLPVCARCTGIYLGAAVVAVVRSGKAWTEREPSGERAAFVLACIPTAATLLYEWTTGDMPSNAVRFAAGLPLGCVVSWLVLPASPRPRRTSQVN